jgi:hypothetical protein
MKIRFRFLWFRNREKKGIPFVNWQAIAKPKVFKRWGLKNIYLFGKGFAIERFWRFIFRDGLWK